MTNGKSELKLEPQGIQDFERWQLDRDDIVQVTWIETLAEFMGFHIWRDGLAELVDIESPENYRNVTGIG